MLRAARHLVATLLVLLVPLACTPPAPEGGNGGSGPEGGETTPVPEPPSPWRAAPEEEEDGAAGSGAGGGGRRVGAPPSSANPAPSAPAEAARAGDLGVTTGGEQDIGWVRSRIESGRVPPPDALSVEGLLSEHSIPTAPGGEASDALLYPTVGVGRDAFPDEEETRVTVQVGFGTSLGLDEFERRPLNLAVVLDRSGSMSGEKMDALKSALGELLDRLRPEDRIAVISFHHEAFLHLESRPVEAGLEDVREGVEGLRAGGSTNIEAGLALGIEQVEGHLETDRENRVLLFTDAKPNVGATGPDSFLGRLREAGDKGIGLTAFGIGLDFGRELAYEISQVEGANYVFLEDAGRVAEVFRDLDLLVTPVAHDVRLVFSPAEGWTVDEVHGARRTGEEGAGEVSVRIPTLFFSREEGGGAIVLRLGRTTGATPSAGSPVGELSLSYRPVASRDPEVHVLRPGAPGAGEPGPDGVRKAHALVGVVRAIERACAAWHAGDRREAVAGLEAFLAWFRPRIAEMDHPDLAREADLVEELLQTMREG